MKSLAALVALTLLALAPAYSHDSWISKGGLRNPAGEWCCGAGDCGIKVAGEVIAKQDGCVRRCFFAPPPNT